MQSAIAAKYIYWRSNNSDLSKSVLQSAEPAKTKLLAFNLPFVMKF